MSPQPELRAVDRIEVQVLVDNVTDNLSTLPAGADISHEWAYLIREGLVSEISGDNTCCACHGLALVITVRTGDDAHTVLFDGGPAGYAVKRNGERLATDFGRIDTIVLSHGHWDHAGGLLAALELIRDAGGGEGREIPFHVHPGMFRARASKRPDGQLVPYREIPGPDTLARNGASVVSSTEEQFIHDGRFYVSGEIPRVTSYETGFAGHMSLSDDGEWEPDPLIMDERFLAVNVKDKGLVVFSACSHAGVVNVLKHAAEVFPGVPLHAVMGGFHLAGPGMEQRIAETVRDMRDFGLDFIVPGHCTGFRAVHALLNEFGDGIVVPSAVGRFHVF